MWKFEIFIGLVSQQRREERERRERQREPSRKEKKERKKCLGKVVKVGLNLVSVNGRIVCLLFV